MYRNQVSSSTQKEILWGFQASRHQLKWQLGMLGLSFLGETSGWEITLEIHAGVVIATGNAGQDSCKEHGDEKRMLKLKAVYRALL